MDGLNPDMIVNTLREELKRRPRTMTYEDITADTGIDDDWLSRFVRGKVKCPSFNNITKLYCYMYKTRTINL